MWCSYRSFLLLIYYIATNLCYVFLRYVALQDYFYCFLCKEMGSLDAKYDYIVVGSGSAGSIVARRLAEDADVKVLLIEAGANANSLLDIPAVGMMLQTSIYDWQYRTLPQKKACLGLSKKESMWPMGKIFGGTSRLHNMVYVRGHPRDFSNWYKNKTDFNYALDILPYFQKLETSETDNLKASAVLSDLAFVSNFSRYILQAANSLGFYLSDVLNGEPGFSAPKVTQREGSRWTPAHQLKKLKQKNLVIFPNSLVEKVLLRSNYEAYGVRYSHLGDHYVVKASKGVILSAGTIGTPKILMLSGIGPKHHLQTLKIKPRIDLPVGDNLQDHVSTGLDLVLLNTSVNLGVEDLLSPYSAFQYFIQAKGPWTTAGCENLALFTSEGEAVADLQFMVLPVGVTSDNGTFLKNLVGIDNNVWRKYFSKVDRTAVTILPIVLHPKSRGTVRLRDRNPKSPPLIDPNYLASKYDVDVMIRGINIIKRLIDTKPMKELGASLNSNVFPGCERFKFDSVPYWECYVRHLTLTVYHPVGTCALEQVVDFDFRVKGTSNLYVVDGSVLPGLPSGNPNAAIMMMAEKAADVIKEHRRLSSGKSNARKMFVGKSFC